MKLLKARLPLLSLRICIVQDLEQFRLGSDTEFIFFTDRYKNWNQKEESGLPMIASEVAANQNGGPGLPLHSLIGPFT